MTGTLKDVEFVMATVTATILDNETYFGELDAVVGDGDFGYSLARGFEILRDEWDTLDRSDPGTFLVKIAGTVSARIGGTSGPIWGTAILRAGVSDRARPGQLIPGCNCEISGAHKKGILRARQKK